DKHGRHGSDNIRLSSTRSSAFNLCSLCSSVALVSFWFVRCLCPLFLPGAFPMSESSNRRDFLKTTAAVGGVAVAGNLAVGAYAAGNETIKVGLIGCGGRGRGAIENILEAERRLNKDAPKVEIVAVADAFKSQAERAARDFADPKHETYGQYAKHVKIT